MKARAGRACCLACAMPQRFPSRRRCAPAKYLRLKMKKRVADLTRRLMRFTPEVEPAAQEPGVFWFNGAGLQASLCFAASNGLALCSKISRAQGFSANLAVGFTRFGSYAVAKSEKGDHDLSRCRRRKRRARERRAAQPLEHRAQVSRYAVQARHQNRRRAVGLAAGRAARALRQRSASALPHGRRRSLDAARTAGDRRSRRGKRLFSTTPRATATRLLFLIKQLLHPLLTTLAARHQALVALWLSLLIDHGDWFKESLRPAVPTLDAVQILDLVRLRLESLQLAAGAIEIELRAEACAATSEQLRLFTEKPTRDLDAANRALARLRAEFGDDAVVCAKLTDGHLPEARFTWEPLTQVKLPTNVLNPSTALRAGSAKRLNDLNGLNSFAPNICPPRQRQSRSRFAGGPYHTTKTAGSSWAPSMAPSTNSPAPTFLPAAGGTAKSSANTTTPKPAAAICSGSTTTG